MSMSISAPASELGSLSGSVSEKVGMSGLFFQGCLLDCPGLVRLQVCWRWRGWEEVVRYPFSRLKLVFPMDLAKSKSLWIVVNFKGFKGCIFL